MYSLLRTRLRGWAESADGELVTSRADALLFLVWTGSISLMITGATLHFLVSEALATSFLFLAVGAWLVGGGWLDQRAYRRLKRKGRGYDMPSVRNDFWKPASLKQALALIAPGTTSAAAFKILLVPPALAVVLGVAIRFWR